MAFRFLLLDNELKLGVIISFWDRIIKKNRARQT